MSKTIEKPDIAQWEETDSELAKYKITALNSLVNSYKRQNEYLEASIKHIEQVNKELFDRIDKAIEYISHEWFKREQIGISELSFSYTELQHILDILRGKDNESK